MTSTITGTEPKHRADVPLATEQVHQITDLPTPPEPTVAEETPTDRWGGKRILIATPCYGGQVTESYLQSVLGVLRQADREGLDVDLYTSAGESLVTRARNSAVHTFLTHEKNYTHLFFIDADIIFNWNQFTRIVESGYDVAAGVYPLKTLDWDSAVGKKFDSKLDLIAAVTRVVLNTNEAPNPGPDGFTEALDVGTGFMMIAREVFDQIREANPQLVYNDDEDKGQGDDVCAYFDTIIDEGRYLSEDYMFCRLWQRLGGKIHVDMAAPILHHQGVYKYGQVPPT